jgi:8-oxo-dGTP pyrophosphatase MutT (NUDIX family)
LRLLEAIEREVREEIGRAGSPTGNSL